MLGKEEDHKKYLDLHNRIVRLFQDEYTTKNGRLVSDTQTGLVLALHFDLMKEEHREKAEASLESPYGLIKSSWQIQGGRLMLDILVPANTEATVVLPGCENPVKIGSGEWHYEIVYKDSGI